MTGRERGRIARRHPSAREATARPGKHSLSEELRALLGKPGSGTRCCVTGAGADRPASSVGSRSDGPPGKHSLSKELRALLGKPGSGTPWCVKGAGADRPASSVGSRSDGPPGKHSLSEELRALLAKPGSGIPCSRHCWASQAVASRVRGTAGQARQWHPVFAGAWDSTHKPLLDKPAVALDVTALGRTYSAAAAASVDLRDCTQRLRNLADEISHLGERRPVAFESATGALACGPGGCKATGASLVR